MARDFIKSLNDYMLLGSNAVGPLVDGASVISLHAWVLADSLSPTPPIEGPKNVIFSSFAGAAGQNGFAWIFVNDSNELTCVSSPPGGATYVITSASSLSTGQLYSVGAVIDFAGNSLRLYIDGNLDASANIPITVSSYNHVAPPASVYDSIGTHGTPAYTTTPWDGMLSEISVYDTDIGDEGFDALAGGIDPLTMTPLPIFYLDLGRFDLRCPISGVEAQITGTLGQRDHPPMIYSPRRLGSTTEHIDPIGGPHRVDSCEIVRSGAESGNSFVSGRTRGQTTISGAAAGDIP